MSISQKYGYSTPVDEEKKLCPECKKPPTPEGHDACLGTLPGVKNACCGHGEEGYIQFENDTVLRFDLREVDNKIFKLFTRFSKPSNIINDEELHELLQAGESVVGMEIHFKKNLDLCQYKNPCIVKNMIVIHGKVSFHTDPDKPYKFEKNYIKLFNY